jgi:pimeloyl-ACP methyl ester carboxylesterase
VQVLEGGQGDPVLLLHGGNGVAAQWEPLLSRLSSGFHIYAPDRPGCGLTDMFNYRDVPLREHAVNFVRSTMDALGLKTVNLVGNSMGGYFALVFALAHPERVKRLVTVGEPAGSSAMIPPGNRLLAMRGLNGLMYATVMKPGASATYEGFQRILVAHPERLSPAYLNCCTAASEIPGATESWLTLLEDCHITSGRSTLTYSLRPELPKLSMPTLLIWGDKDSFGPPSLAQEMAQSMPDGHAEVVPEAGHLAWLDQPDTVAGLIANFLRS